jgi:hypothetical protein
LDGFLTRSGESLIFAGKYLGIVASFSDHGDLNYLANSIAPPKQAVLMERDDMRWVRHGPLSAALALGATQETFCVLVRRLQGSAIRSVIDLYETETGRYLGSLLLPASDKWTSVAVGGNNLYASSDDRIARWSIEVLANPGRGSSSFSGVSIAQVRPADKKNRQEEEGELARQKSPGISAG